MHHVRGKIFLKVAGIAAGSAQIDEVGRHTMVRNQIGWPRGILTALCVLMIFFFPATFGPYSAVHGPVTPLRAAQAAIRLQLSIIQAALGFFWTSRIPVLAWASSPAVVSFESDSATILDNDCVTTFRC